MKLKVNVTDKHIRQGRPGWDDSCAIALAILDVMPGYKVSVLPGLNIRFYKKGSDSAQFQADTPAVASHFAKVYDGAGKEWVGPIEFELNLEPVNSFVTTGAKNSSNGQ